MATEIISFGFRYGRPSGAFIIDVRRRLANPHANPRLRTLDGRDRQVRDWLRARLEWPALVTQVTEWAHDHDGPVYIGCHGGRHRSVALAIEVGARLGVPVCHRDL